jgi:hypothetical protein
MFGQPGASYKTELNRLADVISNKQSVVFRTLVATVGAKNAPKSFSRTSTKRLPRPRNFIRCWSRPETGGTLMNEDVEKTLTRNIAAFNLKHLTEAIANLIKDNSQQAGDIVRMAIPGVGGCIAGAAVEKRANWIFGEGKEQIEQKGEETKNRIRWFLEPESDKKQ